MDFVGPYIQSVMLKRIKDEVVKCCPKNRYDFSHSKNTHEYGVEFIPTEKRKEYISSNRKRVRNREKARLLSPYLKYTHDNGYKVYYHARENIVIFNINIKGED